MEVEGVIQARDHVLARGSTLHVVRSSSGVEQLVVELEETGEYEHLNLPNARSCLPSSKCATRDVGKVEAVGKLPGEAVA